MPPTLPTFAAWRIEPMPSTIVQKITGEIIILIRVMKPVPSGLSGLAELGRDQADDHAGHDGGDHGQIEVVGAVRLRCGLARPRMGVTVVVAPLASGWGVRFR